MFDIFVMLNFSHLCEFLISGHIFTITWKFVTIQFRNYRSMVQDSLKRY